MLIYFDTKTNFIPPKGSILGMAKGQPDPNGAVFFQPGQVWVSKT